MQIGFIYSGGMTEYSDGDDADTILRHEDEALDDVKRRRTDPDSDPPPFDASGAALALEGPTRPTRRQPASSAPR